MDGTPSSKPSTSGCPGCCGSRPLRVSALARLNVPWLPSLADNPVFMLFFPLVLAGVRWWYRDVVWPADLPGDSNRLAEGR